MTLYARPNPDYPRIGGPIDVRDFESPPPPRRGWVPLIVDAQPVPNASQVVIDTGIVIGQTEAHQTWGLRDKTQAELDADAQAAELAQLKAMVAALTTDIQAGITAAPTTAAQAFVEIQDLKRRALRTDRAIRWLLKQQA
jgi:hypothetical protein